MVDQVKESEYYPGVYKNLEYNDHTDYFDEFKEGEKPDFEDFFEKFLDEPNTFG